MHYILAPEWSHLGIATAAAFVLGYALCWGMDKLFLKRLVDDRIAGIALSCGLAFVLIMALATFALTWIARSDPHILGRPIVIPPFPYAVSLIFGLAIAGVIRTILYGREYQEGDDQLVFDEDLYDQAQYDEEVLAWDAKHAHKNYFQRHWARADPRLAVGAGELDEPVEARAPRSLADPGPAGHRLPRKHGAQIVDLVANDDPDIGVDMRRIGGRPPMLGRHVLDPAHPHRIVDMAELVGVGRLRGDAFLIGVERTHGARPAPASSAVTASTDRRQGGAR